MQPETVKPRTSPRDFFLHLGVIVTLYITAGSLMALLFQIINYKFPDALAGVNYYGTYYDPYSGAVRWAIASLIITFPLFWLITWILNRDYTAEPERKSLGIRKWLVYLTLFIAGVTIMIDLIVLINTFLGGEITARFVLKVIAVLIVAGLIFGYYIYDLRKYPHGPSKELRVFLGTAAALIVLSIISGFFVMGSPATQRNLQFDMRRVEDLQGIQGQVVNYWQRKQSLPQSLSDLADPISNFTVPTDPATHASYEYKATGDTSFELCATFTKPSAAMGVIREMPAQYPGAFNDVWTHDAGRQCFERTIDPELYPPVTPLKEGTSGTPSRGTVTKPNAGAPDYAPGNSAQAPLQQ